MMSAPWVVLFVALWLVVAALVVVVLGLNARLGELCLQMTLGPSPVVAPDPLAGVSVAGSVLPALPGHENLTTAGAARVLLFLGATCPPCAQLAVELRDGLDRALAEEALSRVVITVVTDQIGAGLYADVCDHIVTQPDGEIARALGVTVTPFGIAVDADLAVSAARVPNRLEDVVGLARAASGELAVVQAGA